MDCCIESIKLPNSIKVIDGSFSFCFNLKNIIIPNSVTTITSGTFYGCRALESVTMPNNITNIDGHLFYGCEKLKNVTIPEKVTNIECKAFYGCSSLKSIIIPNNVTNIESNAFEGCSSLENLYISSTIESIGEHAFAECNNLLEIKVASKKAITANENIFSEDAYNNAYLYVPTDRSEAYAKTTPWNKFTIREENFTSIDNVIENGNVQTTYDLNGRKIENPTKGIYIINGKKVIKR